MSTEQESFFKIVEEWTAERGDDPHGYGHGLAVLGFARAIMFMDKLLLTQAQIKVMEACCMTHDLFQRGFVEDPKYPSRTKEAFTQHLRDYFHRHGLEHTLVEVVLDINDNVSWSKERAGKRKDLGQWNGILNLVTDADRLDALGAVGWDRCFRFARHMTNSEYEAKKEVLIHCKKKLLTLQHGMHYPAAIMMASPLHEQLRIEYLKLKEEMAREFMAKGMHTTSVMCSIAVLVAASFIYTFYSL